VRVRVEGEGEWRDRKHLRIDVHVSIPCCRSRKRRIRRPLFSLSPSSHENSRYSRENPQNPPENSRILRETSRTFRENSQKKSSDPPKSPGILHEYSRRIRESSRTFRENSRNLSPSQHLRTLPLTGHDDWWRECAETLLERPRIQRDRFKRSETGKDKLEKTHKLQEYSRNVPEVREISRVPENDGGDESMYHGFEPLEGDRLQEKITELLSILAAKPKQPSTSTRLRRHKAKITPRNSDESDNVWRMFSYVPISEAKNKKSREKFD